MSEFQLTFSFLPPKTELRARTFRPPRRLRQVPCLRIILVRLDELVLQLVLQRILSCRRPRRAQRYPCTTGFLDKQIKHTDDTIDLNLQHHLLLAMPFDVYVTPRTPLLAQLLLIVVTIPLVNSNCICTDAVYARTL